MADPPSEGDGTSFLAHVLPVWLIVLLVLSTAAVMGFLLACPALSLILYRIQTGSGTTAEAPRVGSRCREPHPPTGGSLWSERSREM
uniref:Uncharacterized protein n=1 Tax=Scleropages formosus TaxID=113540 RepID=A0A8C9V5J4_SCLFO